ncbi:MAG: outer membrane beta-barrel protein [Prevotella sp.]|nr:outer membrane beta-barrel protein [Prevotella sp.]MBP5508119.1 outer membrane beta-barrel protein [Prevotella sp.]
MRKAVLLLLMLMPALTFAQGDVEYRMEIGGGLGLLTYEGDFSGSILKGGQPMGEIILRRNINPYHGFKLHLGVGKLKGSSKNAETYYPGMAETPYEFSNLLGDLSATYEYNFWPYGTGRDYRGAKRFTPFIAIGLGTTFVKTDDKNVFTANLPIGAGVKYKLGDRLNLGMEWNIHFSLSDKLDGQADPYSIKSSGLFKNTDCYSALQVTLTYSFMAKCRTCHNDDE